MKKYALSFLVIFAFLIYAYHQQQEGVQAVQSVVPPSGVTSSPSSSPSDIPNPAASDIPLSTTATTPVPTPIPPSSGYRDGTYTGDSADAFYGFVQVQATIKGGRISDVQFLDYPHDRSTSMMINSQAMPYLQQEAIQAQSANVDVVSGATDTSQAFVQSLSSALEKAKG